MSSKGCIVVHGLGGTPACVSIVTHQLLSKGYRICAPCLAGHGASALSLSKATAQEWYATVSLAYRQLQREVDQVYYVGASLGALLGLNLAIERGWGVRALALIGTPLELHPLHKMLANFVKYTQLYRIVSSIKRDLNLCINEPEGRHLYSQYSLERMPVRSVFELMRLQKQTKERLREISNPLLLLHGANDRLAPLGNLDIVKKGVSSDVVETWIAKRSGHVICMDYDRSDMAIEIVNFFNRF